MIDVTGLSIPFWREDGSPGTTTSGQAVSIIPPSVLATLFHYEREASSEEEATYRQAWLQLMVENAQFRIVQPTGLVSVPEDHFDQYRLSKLIDLTPQISECRPSKFGGFPTFPAISGLFRPTWVESVPPPALFSFLSGANAAALYGELRPSWPTGGTVVKARAAKRPIFWHFRRRAPLARIGRSKWTNHRYRATTTFGPRRKSGD